jgi:hypothetical protein
MKLTHIRASSGARVARHIRISSILTSCNGVRIRHSESTGAKELDGQRGVTGDNPISECFAEDSHELESVTGEPGGEVDVRELGMSIDDEVAIRTHGVHADAVSLDAGDDIRHCGTDKGLDAGDVAGMTVPIDGEWVIHVLTPRMLCDLDRRTIGRRDTVEGMRNQSCTLRSTRSGTATSFNISLDQGPAVMMSDPAE